MTLYDYATDEDAARCSSQQSCELQPLAKFYQVDVKVSRREDGDGHDMVITIAKGLPCEYSYVAYRVDVNHANPPHIAVSAHVLFHAQSNKPPFTEDAWPRKYGVSPIKR